eukprot:snap_masked-scaffold_9-processed-gene-7.42-mRNA-1 protein AED:1.00 eAED:1.00 QI:0/-1/0/0/-1/1/1/0/378
MSYQQQGNYPYGAPMSQNSQWGSQPPSSAGYLNPSSTVQSPGNTRGLLANPGTQIEENGTIKITIVVSDMEDAYLAVHDTVRFLHSLHPEWSMPALVMQSTGPPNEVGSAYKIERVMKKKVEGMDGDETEVSIRRTKTITIVERADEPGFKIFRYTVRSKWESEVLTPSFPDTTFIQVEIAPFPYEPGKYVLQVLMDGGPQDIRTTYCCLCIANPDSVQKEQEAQQERPKVYEQSKSLTNYVKTFNPNSGMMQQLKSGSLQQRSPSPPSHGRGTYTAPAHKTSFGSISQGGFPSGGNSFSSAPPLPYNAPPVYPRTQPPKLPSKISRNDSFPLEDNFSSFTNRSGAADEVRKLFKLYKAGALTKQEFEKEKRKILDRR